ncbi:Lignostilbene-alpha,beta-dioxygenase isozyme I [Cytospora mali]|uniref:Lignostilbene-alpha,beta-dioxygenase isozyme I n=1 Tax=Cytospora mali TaxID=578113 RepID=A0A194W0T8_CYTMA|nr:Lignostilbene-alpha,beta-dioxygenase isozyme I [Valsa mali]
MADIAECAARLDYQPETRFPRNPFFMGAEAPCRFEAEVYNCAVRGEIPPQIDGTYYRAMPDALWAPLYDDDVFINGDGVIDAVRIKDGHADFKQKFVRTEKFAIERVARRAVFGKYRNRYTDDVRVKHKIHSTANTHVVYFENQLLALKEDSLPYAMDPDTLETKGAYDFNGQFTSPTFTAHPKIDPHTGELITMGYEAKGDATTDVAYFLFSKEGGKLEECWFQTPFAGMMHDMAATDKWIIFILTPLTCVPVELLKEGHKHFAWAKDKPLTFGILPRRDPKSHNIKWFHHRNAFYGHTGNAFDGVDGCVYLDAPLTYQNKFWFFPPVGQDMHTAPSAKAPTDGVVSHYVRWKFDPNTSEPYVEPRELVNLDGEMPKVDARYETKPYKHIFLAMHDPNSHEPAIGGAYNSIAKCSIETGVYKYWSAGNSTALHEVAFVPRSVDAPEADGYVISVANRKDKMLTEIIILDTGKIAQGPIAIIELPFRLRAGIHGSWVMGNDLPEDKDFCDMHGIGEDVKREFGRSAAQSKGSNGNANGHGNSRN